MAVPGTELPDDNRIMNVIAEEIGAKADITWLTGQTAAERVGVMVAGGEYPDFINGSEGTKALLDAGALVALDDYLDNYPNIKNYLTEEQWNRLRHEDGKIYIIPQFGIMQGENMQTQHGDSAFWIQKRVLQWADYPTIKTVDEYFDLIEDYIAANPTDESGQANIGFESLNDDWRSFCTKNPPNFIQGYPNDAAAIIDRETYEARIIALDDEAKYYYGKLNELYHNGILDPEAFTLSYDQYIAKLSSGRVVGMFDQEWNFRQAHASLTSQGLDDRGYVPLDLVIDESITPEYFNPRPFDESNGIGISVSCEDVEGALKFLNDLLEPEIMTLRYWGEEGTDYEVAEDGTFYKTEEQRANAKDTDYSVNNYCSYDYFPHFEGQLADGINAVLPTDQPGEFYETLTDVDKEVLDAYGYQVWTDFLTPMEENSPWFPIWSYTNTLTADTPAGIANQKMNDIQMEWLPRLVMSDDFYGDWELYVKEYDNVDVEAYEADITAEVARRIELTK